jgi:integrase
MNEHSVKRRELYPAELTPRLRNQSKNLRGYTPPPSQFSSQGPIDLSLQVVSFGYYLHNIFKPAMKGQLSVHWWERAEYDIDQLAASKLGQYPLTSLTPVVILGWWGQLVARGYPVAAMKQRQWLRQSLRHAVALEMLAKVPALPKALPKKPDRVRWLTDEQRKAILEEAAKNPRNHVFRYVWLAMHTLTRRASLARLDPRDIDIERGTVTYRHTKNGTDITAPLVPTCLDEIRQWKKERGPFLYHYKHLAGISQAFRRIRSRLGIDGPGAPNGDFTFHDLRHDLATRLVDAGVDLLVIKELGGWKTMAMVARYAHAKDAVKREAMGKVFG